MFWRSIVPVSSGSNIPRILLYLKDERGTGKLYGVRCMEYV
jgi:hypothetical protein